MFISRQVEKCVLVKSMHYPMQEKNVIYFHYVARLESDLLNQCVLAAAATYSTVAAGHSRLGGAPAAATTS